MDHIDLLCVDFTIKETFKDVRTMFQLSNGKNISFNHTANTIHWTHNGDENSTLLLDCKPIGVHGTNFYYSNKKLDGPFGIFIAPCEPFYMGHRRLEKLDDPNKVHIPIGYPYYFVQEIGKIRAVPIDREATGQVEMELKKEMHEIYGQRTYIHDGSFFSFNSMIPQVREATIEKLTPSTGEREVKGLSFVAPNSGFFKFRNTLFIMVDFLIYAVHMPSFSIRRLKTNIRRSYEIPKKIVAITEDGEFIFTSSYGALVETTVWSGRLPVGFIDTC